MCKHGNGLCSFTLFVAIMSPKSRVSACFHEITEFKLEGTLGDLLSKALPKAGLALKSDQVAQGIIQLGFSKGWIAQAPWTTCSTVLMVKKLFLISTLNLFCFNLCPLSPILQPCTLDSLSPLLETSSQVLVGCY